MTEETARKGKTIKGMPYLYKAFITRSLDKSSMGKLQVWIPELGHPEDPRTHVDVRYLSPFAGATSPYMTKTSLEFKDTQKAYGFWMVPPDRGVEGLIGFINGKSNQGVWLGSFYQENVNFTVPGIPAAMTHVGPAPGAEKNKWNEASVTTRPPHEPMYNALKKQGLFTGVQFDAIRGSCTSGAQRESPSRVFGILTPGQHQFVMDDGTQMSAPLPGQDEVPGVDQGIRLRTRMGAQLLLNDEKGIVYIINRDGTAWVELTNEGKMDVFCTDDISYHSLKDFNLHVDGDINMQAKGSFNMRVEGADGININATTGDFQMKTAGNYVIQADLDGNLITGGGTVVKSSRLDLNGGSAVDAVPPETGSLVDNVSVLQSICTRVPEHEPWLGHEDKKLLPLGENLAPASAWA